MFKSKIGLAIVLFAPLLLLAQTEQAYESWRRYFDPGVSALEGKKYDEAERLFKLAYKEIRGSGFTPALASTYSNLGVVFESKNDLKEAKRLYESAVSVSQKSRGTYQPETAMDLYNLARVEGALEKYDDALQHLTFAIDIMRKTGLGKKFPTKVMLELFANIYEKKGDRETAIKLRNAIKEVKWEQ